MAFSDYIEHINFLISQKINDPLQYESFEKIENMINIFKSIETLVENKKIVFGITEDEYGGETKKNIKILIDEELCEEIPKSFKQSGINIKKFENAIKEISRKYRDYCYCDSLNKTPQNCLYKVNPCEICERMPEVLKFNRSRVFQKEINIALDLYDIGKQYFVSIDNKDDLSIMRIGLIMLTEYVKCKQIYIDDSYVERKRVRSEIYKSNEHYSQFTEDSKEYLEKLSNLYIDINEINKFIFHLGKIMKKYNIQLELKQSSRLGEGYMEYFNVFEIIYNKNFFDNIEIPHSLKEKGITEEILQKAIDILKRQYVNKCYCTELNKKFFNKSDNSPDCLHSVDTCEICKIFPDAYKLNMSIFFRDSFETIAKIYQVGSEYYKLSDENNENIILVVMKTLEDYENNKNIKQ